LRIGCPGAAQFMTFSWTVAPTDGTIIAETLPGRPETGLFVSR
jgi:hypothetical protein